MWHNIYLRFNIDVKTCIKGMINPLSLFFSLHTQSICYFAPQMVGSFFCRIHQSISKDNQPSQSTQIHINFEIFMGWLIWAKLVSSSAFLSNAIWLWSARETRMCYTRGKPAQGLIYDISWNMFMEWPVWMHKLS